MVSDDDPLARNITKREKVAEACLRFLSRLRRRLPYLVLRGQEIDVNIKFVSDRLFAADTEEAVRQFHAGKICDAKRALNDAGITFDSGLGFGAREWEWDWSLCGPISIRFVSPASRPARRNQIAGPPKEAKE